MPVGDDAALVEQHDPVGEGDRRRPVGDDDRRPAPHHLGEGVADLVLLRRVDGRGGVVEDEHPGVGEDGAGDGDALALAARQREAALADDGAVAVGQVDDEVVGAGEAGGPLDPARAAASGSAKAMLAATVSAKRNVSSKHDADAPPQVVRARSGAHVDAVEA